MEQLSWFAEFESYVTAERGDRWVGTISAGLTWDITDDTVIEFGASRGVTRSADDWATFIALVQRF